ncbi:MAG: alpha-2-macroglobulin family protein, partial [Myxococcota bacterium]
DGEPDPALPQRPAFGYGSLFLSVPPAHRTLEVEAEPLQAELEPGGSTSVSVTVRDPEGEPVEGAQVLLVVVDEAVLALTGYRLPDPVQSFYPRRAPGVNDASLYSSVLLADLRLTGAQMDQEPMDAMEGAPGAPVGATGRALRRSRSSLAEAAPPPEAMAGAETSAAPIAVRTDLAPLALFAPDLVTGAGGKAETELSLPDNLTRYRVMAVATDGAKRFGSGESTVTARLPLMVRPSLPRFLNLGDQSALPFVVQNQTDEDMTAALAVRAAGLELGEDAGYRFHVPAQDRVEVRLSASAGRVGTVRVQVAAAAGEWSDAAEVSLPVWTPVSAEAFATYGTIDEGAIRQPVEAPEDARPDFGGLEVTTSSTELQSLTDAVIYLVDYPFDCTEQIASRVLALASLVDVLSAFESESLPSPEELRESVAGDMEKLASRQSYSGGFGLWRRNDQQANQWPYLAIHTTLALVLAKEKGFEVPEQMLRRAGSYLANVERYIPPWYSREARWSTVASSLYVLHRMGSSNPAKARALLAEAGIPRLRPEALGWLLPTLSAAGDSQQVAAIERHLLNRVSETAAGATFTTAYEDGAHLLFHSSRRSDAVIIEGLMHARPESDLIVKVVRGLLAHRTKGRWGSTQENGWVLLALDHYFRRYEGTTPDFVARAWLGDRFAGQQEFEGRTTERAHLSVPMAWLAEREGRQDLILAKDGPGRMYYRIGMRYVPEDLSPPPAEHGFSVERTYEAVDDPDDVRREEDGTWVVKAGARVRVKLDLVAPARRYHVALVDRLPAGLEPMNPALAVTGQVPQEEASARSTRGRPWFWWRPWYEHQNLRDERAEAFASLLWAGVHGYSYVARATTPGRFVAPPPTVEEMYHPETFARGSGEIVVVVEE